MRIDVSPLFEVHSVLHTNDDPCVDYTTIILAIIGL